MQASDKADSLRRLEIDHVARIALGATLLGAGGGGDPYISLLAARQIYADGDRAADLIPLAELDDEAQVICVAGFGAPTVEKERLFELPHLLHGMRTLEQHLGRKADALIAAEMGGFNALVPIMAAAACGLPVIDGDGMGRAFPELQMTSFSLHGISASPFVMTDEHRDTVLCRSNDNGKGERLARAVCMGMGLFCFLAAYPMTGREAKRVAIADTVTLAHALGGAIESARSGKSSIEALMGGIRESAQGIEVARLFDGKVVDVWRSTERGFVIGWLDLAPLNGAGQKVRIEFRNEYLACTLDGKPRALTPDLICLVDSETAEPIPTPDVRYGQRVTALGLSCDPVFRTGSALQVVGPQAFGMDYAYRPLEELGRA
ncbi:MAG: DUF917 domain-containing protein [Gammaproteobacteria bacterium]|nr:DUF917 domain-containing protein [Gammaproteobacteria bacterium]MCY4339787.1 DUF917 domain-containing protein [Gammaproteobacteria bacterium]